MLAIRASILLLIISQFTYAQEIREFHYKKVFQDYKNFQTLAGEDSVSIAREGETKDRVLSRAIYSTAGRYTLALNKKDKKYSLLSEDGAMLASYPLKGKLKYSITVAEGTVYTWQKGADSRQWKYLVDGKEAFTCTFLKEGKKKLLRYQIRMPEAAGIDAAIMMSHFYGVELIHAKAVKPVVYGCAAALGVLTAVISAGQDTTPQIQ